MISLYLRPDKTQLIRGKIKKDKTMFVSLATEIDSYWNELTEQDNIMSNLFVEIKSIVSTTYENFHIVLPDCLFCAVNAMEFLTEEDFMASVRAKTNKLDEDIYYSFPIVTEPGGITRKTFFAIERKYINFLLDIAKKENIAISSIEPASIAFFRSCSSWQEEHFLLEIFDNQATIVSYSPVGGIFSMNVPKLTIKQLSSMSNSNANQEIKSTFAVHDYTAEKIFSSMNINVPFVVLAENKSIFEYEGFEERLAKNKIFPSFINADISDEYHQEWMVLVGTLLQHYELEDELYSTMPPFMRVYSANMVPENIQVEAKLQQWKQLTKKYSRVSIVFLSIIIFLEIIGIIFFSSVTISPKLQADYDAAQKDINDVNSEIKILAISKTDHEYPMEAFSKIVEDRPNNCSFSSIIIGNNGQGKSPNEKWIRLSTVSTDPLIFQNYASTLSKSEMFTNVSLTKMNTDASGLKTAEIAIGKGRIAQ